MFDFSLSNINTDQPSPLSIVYALLLSFILATIISFTYEKTTPHNQSPGHFIQTMILGSIIATVVAQSIGDSIGRGLGMLGILAMIRFRTNLNQPRNIIFIFAALAVGIACGVFSFNIALYGSFLFCIMAFLLSISPLNNYSRKLQSLRVTFALNDRIDENKIEEEFKKMNIKSELVRIEIDSGPNKFEKEYTWQLQSKNTLDEHELLKILNSVANVISMRLNMRVEADTL